MFTIEDRPARLCDGVSRREWLRIGGLSLLGLSLPQLAYAKEQGRPEALVSPSFGKAKSVIFLWLQGGPPQHETFDPKPEAPAEIRGEFRPISTNVPGIQFCELLPRTAAIADKLAIVRSLCTHSDLHDASGYWVLTGYPYKGRQSREIDRASDWPYLGSVLKMLAPSPTLPSYTSVWLPDVMRLNDNVQPAGQTAGFLGYGWDPQRVICDPAAPEFHIEGLTLPPEIPPLRFSSRQSLLQQVEQHFSGVERGTVLRDFDRQTQEAFGLLSSGRARQAFDLEREPVAVRERYGRHKWGQSVLLARRLVEAGAKLIHVNWPREGGDEAVSNPLWDTHAQNADRLQDVLCPQFDVTFAALIEDLELRGLLSETLVVAIGEFGRTPKINGHGGRDHWGHVFSFALAGAGISGARVIGSSDKHGAYPRDGRIEPQDLTATILHLLGVPHTALFPDASGRPLHATTGEPLYALLGDRPATLERTESTGNLALVPPYSKALLLNRDFSDPFDLLPIGKAQRLKGWQGLPIRDEPAASLDFGVALASDGAGDNGVAVKPRQARLGLGVTGPTEAGLLPQGAQAVLTQELRNPRAGTYAISVHAACDGNSADLEWLRSHFRCRVVLFGYRDLTKNQQAGMREYASVPIELDSVAGRSADGAPTTVTRALRSQDAGASEIEMGVGLAMILERSTPGELPVPAGTRAFVKISRIDVSFTPRPRNDDVKV
ncbi:MAG: DUF1501 domain-containing protein [Planctomycetes bacterium]|nr:DUF1501 domain-containing protein [Planctomycetota bacterium]